MLSPFPGMDPYLENPGLWPDVHHEIISVARELLNVQLRPRYRVRVETRVYISDENDPGREAIVPDLRVVEHAADRGTTQPGVVASRDTIEPVVLTTLIDDEIQEARLEVVDQELRSVVTVIEVVSPTHKISGSKGRASFQQKRTEVMNSPSHWVEIDLLRKGNPLMVREVLPRADYFVHVSRTERRPKGEVWPIRLPQPLPSIPIPLKAEDQDAPLDLQQVLNTAYERAAYDLEIDYRVEPIPPLSRDQAAWAHELLVTKGLRN